MQRPNIIEYWTEKATAEARQQGARESTRKHKRKTFDILSMDTGIDGE